MRTFQNDTVLHFITEKASVDYIAGGEKAREAVSSVLLEAKQVYERTDNDVSLLICIDGHGSSSGIPCVRWARIPLLRS